MGEGTFLGLRTGVADGSVLGAIDAVLTFRPSLLRARNSGADRSR